MLQNGGLVKMQMEHMPIYISHMISAMETVGLLLWNTSNVTHIAEHLTL